MKGSPVRVRASALRYWRHFGVGGGHVPLPAEARANTRRPAFALAQGVTLEQFPATALTAAVGAAEPRAFAARRGARCGRAYD